MPAARAKVGKGRGIVAAKSALGVEQKFIDGIVGQLRRRQRVKKRLLPEHRQHRLHELHIVGVRAAQLLRQCIRARIAVAGQPEVAVSRPRYSRLQWLEPAYTRCPPHRRGATTGRSASRCSRREFRPRKIPTARPVEHEYPAVPMRLHHHGIFDSRVPAASRRRAPWDCRRSRPGVAVEDIEHRPAPIALAIRRRRRCRSARGTPPHRTAPIA